MPEGSSAFDVTSAGGRSAPASPTETPTVSSGQTEHPGEMIGPYRLLEVLGEGGFGTVWLAERREPFVQRVALKIIKAGMDTKAVIARFEQERQALAVMDHPSVAKVHDAGTTVGGRPYFVMEHVAGEPITSYCDKHRLTLRQRLELFIHVCEAVQHAHHKGIIHRDLKPSNILVGVRDDQPVPKVIDFGVAKAMSHTLTDKTVFTESGQLIGTPEYMSPEQAEMRGGDVDTRSDVYSLGAVLYELLSGEVPFESSILRREGFDGIRRVIREVDAPKPSTRLSSLDAAAGSVIAQHRRIERAELAAELRHELDWIPLKALRKDRTERYSSPADLAKDIRNYIEGRPLEAGPESPTYRLRKLVRRNKGVCAAGGAVAVALLAGVMGFAWQAHRVGIERDAAVRARQESDAIRQFIQAALQASDPNQGGQQGMLVTDAMNMAVMQLDGGAFGDQPGIEAGLRLTISQVLNGNGKSSQALPMAERALALYRQAHPGTVDHPDLAASLNNLALVLATSGRIAESEPLFVQALEMRRRLVSGDSPEVAESLNNLASTRRSMGRMSDAEELFVQALDMRRRLFPGDHPDVAQNLNNLASLRQAMGRGDLAEPLYQQALDMRRRIYRGDHPDVAEGLNNLALLFESQGRLQEAQPLYLNALEMNQRLFKGDHPAIATGLNNLAGVRSALGSNTDAEPLFVSALEMNQRLYPGDHPDVAMTLNNLAFVRQSLGRPAEAEPAFRQSLEMYQRLFPGDHPAVAAGLSNLAYVWQSLGRAAEAQPLYEQSVEMSRRLYKGDHPQVAQSLHNLASVHVSMGRADQAEPLFQQALQMRQRLFKGDHPDVVQTLSSLGLALDSMGRAGEAESLLAQALDVRRRLYKGDHPDIAMNISNLARVKGTLAKPADARPLFDEAVAMLRRLSPQGSPTLARILWRSGSAYMAEGHPTSALPQLEEAAALAHKFLPPTHPHVKEYDLTLAECQRTLGR